MKRLMTFLGCVGIVVINLILSIALGAFWFGLWMNRGWPGATGLLAKMLHADGEHSYDAMQLEMTAWCFIFLLGLFACGAWPRRKWGIQRQIP
jgi:hypothetical protein